jgi:hypothetical protein
VHGSKRCTRGRGAEEVQWFPKPQSGCCRQPPSGLLLLDLPVAFGARRRLRLSCPASDFWAKRFTLTLPSNTPRPVGCDTMHL